MLYFDRMHEEHFGTIKQQVWASLHFFLHITLVLVLQGVSYLIMCVVALIRMDNVDGKFREIEALSVNGAYANGTLFADALRQKNRYIPLEYHSQGRRRKQSTRDMEQQFDRTSAELRQPAEGQGKLDSCGHDHH